jgi:hypothetical protein
VPNLNRARPFHLNSPPSLAVESVFDQFVCAARDLNDPASSLRFHAARQVYAFALQVIDELLTTDDTGHDRTGVDTDTERERATAEEALRDRSLHVERQVDEHACVVGSRPRHADATM